MPKTKGASQQVTLKIPKSLTDEVDQWVETNGFTSRAEFVKEAVRKMLAEYRTEKLK